MRKATETSRETEAGILRKKGREGAGGEGEMAEDTDRFIRPVRS